MRFVSFTLVAEKVTEDMCEGEILKNLGIDFNKKEGIYSPKFNTIDDVGGEYTPHISLTDDEDKFVAISAKFVRDTAKECETLLKEFKEEIKKTFKCKKIRPLLITRGTKERR